MRSLAFTPAGARPKVRELAHTKRRLRGILGDVKRCFYCGDLFVPCDQHPPEHILPAAIEAELTTSNVCAPCNTWAGREIDQPWLSDPMVQECRYIHGLKDRRGRVPSASFLPGTLVDGQAALVRRDRDGVLVRRRPTTTQLGDGSFLLSGYTGEEYPKAVKRLKARYPDMELVQEATVEDRILTGTVTWELSVQTWPRFGAKVALGLASLVEDEHWLDTAAAKELRDVMRNGHLPNVDTDDGCYTTPGVGWSAVPLVLEPGPANGVIPPGHFLKLDNGPNGRRANLVICGELGYIVPMGPPADPLFPWWRLERAPT